jgi:ParB-like chromosome segregation protein Spo0J
MTAKQKYASVAVDDLTLDPANINQHDDAGIGAIAESLRTFGQQKPIVATREHVVAAGNGTVMAAIELGMQTLDVRYTDLTVKQLRFRDREERLMTICWKRNCTKLKRRCCPRWGFPMMN